jgi:hypothetical protein
LKNPPKNDSNSETLFQRLNESSKKSFVRKKGDANVQFSRWFMGRPKRRFRADSASQTGENQPKVGSRTIE